MTTTTNSTTTTTTTTTATTDSKFTEKLKEAAGETWNNVVNHKFTNELAAGTIDKQVLIRYLIQDHRFLDSFLILLSSIIAHAPNLQDRIFLGHFLGVIVGPENTYFERSFDHLKVSKEDRETIPNAKCTTALCELMREVAHSKRLGDMLAVVVVCEWSYGTWGQRVLPQTVRNDNNDDADGSGNNSLLSFCTYEWVDLHSGDYFTSVVDYLKGMLDRHGGEHEQEEIRQSCQERFLQTIQLEQDFFDNAYVLV